MSWYTTYRHYRRTGSRAHLYQLRGAAESQHENEHAPVHPVDERLSKKIENHIAMIALFHMHYNFVRIHQTLRGTPAMEAGLSSHVWSIYDIVALASNTAINLAA